jgi:hypothetical protein
LSFETKKESQTYSQTAIVFNKVKEETEKIKQI